MSFIFSKIFAVILLLLLGVKPGVCTIIERELQVVSYPITASFLRDPSIRVLLRKQRSITLSFNSTVNIFSQTTGAYLEGLSSSLLLELSEDGIKVNKEYVDPGPILLTFREAQFQMDNNLYQGRLIIDIEERNLLVIGHFFLEDYLKGVVPSEIFPTWPEDCLKAQAVASRTYALFSILRSTDEKYDVVNTDYSQVFSGVSKHHERTSKAVDDTMGEVLTFQNKVFPAFFHSTSGGHLTPAHQIWFIQPHPSLGLVYDPFGKESPYAIWEFKISHAELSRRLRNSGLIDGKLQHLSVGQVDALGRVVKLIVVTEKGSYEINANKFRLAVGSKELKSMLVDIYSNEDSYHFKGRGWGHGSGLSQWGAKEMSEQGYSYQEILKFYYPFSQISHLQLKYDI